MAFEIKTQGPGIWLSGREAGPSPPGEVSCFSLVTLCSGAAFVTITLDAYHFDGVSVSGFSVLDDTFSLLEKQLGVKSELSLPTPCKYHQSE